MALIKCAECGKEISDSAERCPNCGCTTKAGKERSEAKGWAVSGLIFIGVTILGIVLLLAGNTLMGIWLTAGGVITLLVLEKKLKEEQAQKEWDDKVASGEIDLGDGKEWKCRCGGMNMAGLKRCYSCGQSREQAEVK